MTPPDHTSGLLRRGTDGDLGAFAELRELHEERLRRTVRLRMDHRLRGRCDADDVMQEAFVDFSRRAGEYLADPEVPFFVWLPGIA